MSKLQPVAQPVHFPTDPDRFVFDDKVAAIFDNMAVRSLPGYRYYFDRVTEIVALSRLPNWSQVWDMGVSTGAGLDAVKRAVHHPFVEYYGVDISDPMLEKAKERCPYGVMINHDLMRGLPLQVEPGKVAIFMWNWTLQFMQDKQARARLLKDSADSLAPGGMIFVAEKYVSDDPDVQTVLEDAYYKFRLDNGYTLAEIKAKSKALENSMWPWRHSDLLDVAETCGLQAIPLFRQYNFGGYVLKAS